MRLNYNPGREKAKQRKIIREKVANQIFLVLGITAGIGAFMFSPYGLHFLAKGAIHYYFHKRKFQTVIAQLRRKGYVSVIKKPDGYIVRLLKSGHRKLAKLQIENLTLPITKNWDGKWRIFIFDIPEKYKILRDNLTRKLKKLGMFHIQRSVFVFPYDCRQELKFICTHYGVARYTSYGELVNTDLKSEFRSFFQRIL